MNQRFKLLVGAILLGTVLTGCFNSNDNDTDTAEVNTSALGYQTELADGTIDYVDYKGEKRNAVATVAESEYHTDIGYEHTLFDSADKKCQNCHNELYDSWKGSMHGRSWSDPIFQSKMQDFLRTHITKIGSNPTGDKEYTEGMYPKVAQTCIKCHAPGAYYAGDFKVTLTKLKHMADTSDLNMAKENNQSNLAPAYDPTQPASVVAIASKSGALYQATYHIGHEANREGINCAFCHSIETPRLMEAAGADGGQMTLAKALRVGPHGPIKADAGDTLTYSPDATDGDMNKFFRLWGPEKYKDYAHTPKTAGFDVNKSADGRYVMVSKDLNGTNGKVHFTGGPFYGPYGITGTTNENETDETNRTAQINPHYNIDTNNHYGNKGKALCLSCHQRSAGAADPTTGHFMELCSTWNAVTTGDDSNHNDSATSPKCQKCHMERIEGTVLHQWARPDKLWTLADNPHLTGHFDPDDPDNYGEDNPVAAKWLNSHAFLGASKTGGDKVAAVAKIKSGFDADLSVNQNGDTLEVMTMLTNKTGHMFPGAHPMRRVFTRVIVTDANGTKVDLASATGESSFGTITNKIATLTGKTIHSSGDATVTLEDAGSTDLDFPGKIADLDGSTESSQKFDGSSVTIFAADGTVKNQEVNGTKIQGTVKNAAIVNGSDLSNFTRIYGHETGKKYNGVFVVRPGFDSNIVGSDNRLSPNETENYTLTYDISGKSNLSVTYKVYYMQKGANGSFPSTADGWLDNTVNAEKKLLITEVYSKTIDL